MAHFLEKYMVHLSSHKSGLDHMSFENFQTAPRAIIVTLSWPDWILPIAFPGAKVIGKLIKIMKTVCLIILKTPLKEKHYLIHCADSWRHKESSGSKDCLSQLFYYLISQMSKGNWCNILKWPKIPKWSFFKEFYLHLDTLSRSLSWQDLSLLLEHPPFQTTQKGKDYLWVTSNTLYCIKVFMGFWTTLNQECCKEHIPVYL